MWNSNTTRNSPSPPRNAPFRMPSHWNVCWSDTESVLKSAETALQSGDYALAKAQAGVAEQQALMASNQAYLEKARYLINATKSRRHLMPQQRATLKEAEAALHKHDGKQAFTLINQLY